MLPRFREPTGFLDLVVGFGPKYLPMDWLYAMTIVARTGWDRDWLLSRLQAIAPSSKGRQLAWSLDVRMHYSGGAFDVVGHECLIKITDSLVHGQFLDELVTNIRRLFIDAERELTDSTSRLAGESER